LLRHFFILGWQPEQSTVSPTITEGHRSYLAAARQPASSSGIPMSIYPLVIITLQESPRNTIKIFGGLSHPSSSARSIWLL
jgi:hypothetical protein